MTVSLPWTKPPLTQNQLRKMHFYKEAEIKSSMLEDARWAIRAAKVQPIDRAVVILHWRMANRRRQDGDGAAPTLKVCLDALVAEGVLRDDSFVEVPHSGITCHAPIAGKPGALWLSVEAVA